MTAAVDTDGRPTAPTTRFAPDDPVIHVSALVTGAATGAVLTSTWEHEQEGVFAEVPLELNPGSTYNSFEMTRPTAGWPAGGYTLTLTVANPDGERLSRQAVFEVVEASAAAAASPADDAGAGASAAGNLEDGSGGDPAGVGSSEDPEGTAGGVAGGAAGGGPEGGAEGGAGESGAAGAADTEGSGAQGAGGGVPEPGDGIVGLDIELPPGFPGGFPLSTATTSVIAVPDEPGLFVVLQAASKDVTLAFLDQVLPQTGWSIVLRQADDPEVDGVVYLISSDDTTLLLVVGDDDEIPSPSAIVVQVDPEL